MRRSLSSLLCATTLLITGASVLAIPQQAVAQVSMRIGFDFFHNRLVRDGRWIRHPVWGDVWRPRLDLVGPDFQPYTNGYWEYTDDYGWYWVSNDRFDDVVYHYGRWVYDPQWNWLWIPGYTWAPAWVVWREGDDYTGWMPMPPDEDFISGSGPGFGVNIGPFGIDFYNRWYGSRVDPDRFFVFVGNRNLIDRDYRRFVVPRDRVKIIIKRTRPITKFEVVNNHVVNRGIDVRIVERATGRRIAPVSAKTVIKPGAIITTVNEAKQIRQRERVAHPIDVTAARRGNAGGAPATNGNTGATPATGTEGGERMRNPGGESMTGPSIDQPNKNRGRGNANGNTNAGDSTTAPDQTVAPPTGGTETKTPRRPRGGSNPGTMDQATPDTMGASPGSAGGSPNGNSPRRRGGNSGSMNDPNATTGGNGAVQTQGGTANGPATGNQGAQTPQAGSTDAEPKKKRKPKSPPTQEPGSPE